MADSESPSGHIKFHPMPGVVVMLLGPWLDLYSPDVLTKHRSDLECAKFGYNIFKISTASIGRRETGNG